MSWKSRPLQRCSPPVIVWTWQHYRLNIAHKHPERNSTGETQLERERERKGGRKGGRDRERERGMERETEREEGRERERERGGLNG